MSHFVCQGDCKTVSDNPGICESDFCNKQGEDLKICGCLDGEHSHPDSSENSESSEETI